MANIVLPNMGLIVPTVGSEPGPTFASDINASLTLLDPHNHSPGFGAQITPAGLNINTTLPFAGNAATALSYVAYTPQTSVTALEATYVKGVDLYYRDGNNNEIAITTGGSVNGSSGTITGLPSGTAGAAYSGGVFAFSAATNTPANIQMGSALLGNNSALSKYLTLQPPLAMASNYSLTLPALPASTSYMTLTNAGVIASVTTIPGSALTVASITTTQIASATILTGNIASATILTGNIAANTILPGNLDVANSNLSSSCGSFSNSGSSIVDITNLTTTLTVSKSTKQVMMQIIADASASPCSMSGEGAYVYFYVNGAQQGVYLVGTTSDSGFFTPVIPANLSQLVAPLATTSITYKIRVNPQGSGFTMSNAKLFIWEI